MLVAITMAVDYCTLNCYNSQNIGCNNNLWNGVSIDIFYRIYT